MATRITAASLPSRGGQEHVESYAAITGDMNPLHFDEAFAAGSVFKARSRRSASGAAWPASRPAAGV